MKKKKPNPRRRPATQADVEKAKLKARDEAVEFAIALFLTTMLDKEGATREDLQRIWKEVNSLSDSVAQGYIKPQDLINVLVDEYDIELTFTNRGKHE